MYLGNTTVAGTLGIVGAATASTQSSGDNSTRLATTAYVMAATATAATIGTTGGSTTLSATQYGVPVILVTGTLTSAVTLIVPNSGQWKVSNRTNGAYAVLVTTSAGTGVVVPFNQTLSLLADGTNVVQASRSLRSFSRSELFGPGVPLLWSRSIGVQAANLTGSTDIGGTSQLAYITPYAMHDFQAVYENYTSDTSAGDAAPPNPITISASMVDPNSGLVQQMTFGGQKTVTLPPFGVAKTDIVGSSAAANSSVYIRTYVQIALAPTNAACAAANSGGTLASNTYYYKITAVCGAQGESGPSSEVSGTTTGTGTMTLSWGMNPCSVAPTAFNIYRSTVSGDEIYLTTVLAGPGTAGAQFSWTDTGAISQATLTGGTGGSSSATLTVATQGNPGQPLTVGSYVLVSGTPVKITAQLTETGDVVPGFGGTYTMASAQTITTGTSLTYGAAPPSYQVWVASIQAFHGTGRSSEGGNYVAWGGNGANGLAATALLQLSAGAGDYFYGPTAVLGTPDAGYDVPVVNIVGDSIAFGSNATANQGFIAYALQNASPLIAYFQRAQYGETLNHLLVGSDAIGNYRTRIETAKAATDTICEYDTNDISGGSTLAQMQGYMIPFWVELAKRSLRVWQTTMLPRTNSSSDVNGLPTIASGGSGYAASSTFNVTLAGGTLASGASATTISVTTNASGVVTTVNSVGYNGGYSVAPSTTNSPTGGSGSGLSLTVAYGTFTSAQGQTPQSGYGSGGVMQNLNTWLRAGAPLASSSSLTAVAVGTSGALLAGQSGHPLTGVFDPCSVVEVNSSNVLTQGGGCWISNGTAEYYTQDGTHPNVVLMATMAATINTALFIAP